MFKTQNFRHFEFFWNIGQEAGPFSKNISKISYFQISQELIILGKKQMMDINWQKIPYKKDIVYFFGLKFTGLPQWDFNEKISKISQFYFTKSHIKPLITVYSKIGAEEKNCVEIFASIHISTASVSFIICVIQI